MIKNCYHHLLAKSGNLSVEYCQDCNVIHLCLDFISAKFKPAAFFDLCELINSAQRQIHHSDEEYSSVEAKPKNLSNIKIN